MHDMTSITVSDISTEMLLLRNEHFIFKMIQGKIFIICYILGRHIEKYARRSDLTGKNQAGPTMFSAYWSESPVKICSLIRSGNNFLFVGPLNSVLKSVCTTVVD